MNCERCGTKAYHYERHGFWQCPNSTCNHSWKDKPETVTASTLGAVLHTKLDEPTMPMWNYDEDGNAVAEPELLEEVTLRARAVRRKRLNDLHAAIADVESRGKRLASDAELERFLSAVEYLRDVARGMG